MSEIKYSEFKISNKGIDLNNKKANEAIGVRVQKSIGLNFVL